MAQGKRNIYRKSALDRLSSPDQLDKPITIVPSGIWFAIAGGFIACGITLVWALIGRIPVTVQTSGIYTYGEGVNSIYATNGGVVSDVYVENGDAVQEGDLIAELENDVIEARLDYINERRALVEAVTLDSTDDDGNADNKEMRDIKSQLLTVTNNKDADDLLLSEKQKEMADATAKADAARDAMNAARDEYYAGLNEGSSTEEQLKMQDARDDASNARNNLTIAKNDYESAKNDIATAKNDVSLAKNDVATAKSDLDRIKSQIQSEKNDVSTAKGDLDQLRNDIQTSKNDIATAKNDLATAKSDLATVNNDVTTAKNNLAAINSEKATAESYLISAQNSLTSAKQRYDAFLRGADFKVVDPGTYDGSFDTDSNFAVQKQAQMEKLASYQGELIDYARRMHNIDTDHKGGYADVSWATWDDKTHTAGKGELVEGGINKPDTSNSRYSQWAQYKQTAAQLADATNACVSTIQQLENQRKQLAADVETAKNKVKDQQKYIDDQKFTKRIEDANTKISEAEGKIKPAQYAVDVASTGVSDAEKAYSDKQYDYEIFMAGQKISAEENGVRIAESQKNNAQSTIDDAKSNVASEQDNVSEAKRRAEEVYSQIAIANDRINDAVNKYCDAENAYLDAEQRQLALHAGSQINSDGYNNALNDYRTELQYQRSIDDALVELRARAISDGIKSQTQKELIGIQFENAKASALAKIDKDYKEQEANMRNTQLRATRTGTVTDLHITVGSAVQAGATVANVKADAGNLADFGGDMIISYVPVSEGKKIRDGMEVKVYPTTADRNEYGHMRGTVVHVDNYVTSKEDMMNVLGDSTLVDSFLQNGPVVAVTIALDMDPTTVSGYYWSSIKGKQVNITAGTTVATDTVIDNKAPIDMLIPFLLDRFDKLSAVEQNSNNSNNGEQSGNNG